MPTMMVPLLAGVICGEEVRLVGDLHDIQTPPCLLICTPFSFGPAFVKIFFFCVLSVQYTVRVNTTSNFNKTPLGFLPPTACLKLTFRFVLVVQVKHKMTSCCFQLIIVRKPAYVLN